MPYEGTLRAAGQVKRYHTQTTIQSQTVSEHTWQMLRIWLELFGRPSADIATAIVLHDVGEEKTGDLPHMVKRDYPELKRILSKIEKEHAHILVDRCRHKDNDIIRPGLFDLSSSDIIRIKMCELIEMAEFALDEYNLGNQKRAIDIVDNVKRAFVELVGPSTNESVERARGRLRDILAKMGFKAP